MRSLRALLRILLVGPLLRPRAPQCSEGAEVGSVKYTKNRATSKSQMLSCDTESSGGVDIQNSRCR